jgi:hypothetical protein
MTYAEWVERVRLEAQRGSEQAELSQLDTQPIIEAIQPSVFQSVGEACAADPRKRDLLKRTVTVTLAAGIGTLPDYVLEKYMEDSTIYDADDLTKTFSWVRNFNDFIGPLNSLLGYYNVPSGHTIYVRDVGEDFSVPLSLAIDVQVNVPCVPVRPALPTDQIDVADEITSDLVDTGAAFLRGELSKAATAGT